MWRGTTFVLKPLCTNFRHKFKLQELIYLDLLFPGFSGYSLEATWRHGHFHSCREAYFCSRWCLTLRHRSGQIVENKWLWSSQLSLEHPYFPLQRFRDHYRRGSRKTFNSEAIDDYKQTMSNTCKRSSSIVSIST